MTRPRSSVPAALGMAALLLLSVAAPAATQEGEGTIDPESLSLIPLVGSEPIDLLAPFGHLLSSRAGLATEGLGVGLSRGASIDPTIPLDLQAAVSGSSSRTQAAGAGAPVPFRQPGPAFSRNILVTRDFGRSPFQNEPHLAVSDRDHEHIVLGVIDYAFPSMSSYVSFDAGERWEGPFQVPYLLEDLGAGGDPVIDFDREDNVYMAYISIGIDEFNLGPVEVAAQVSSIAVAKSEDAGFTWPVQISTARSRVDTEGLEPDRFGLLRGTVSISFLDKPWMAIGPHPSEADTDVIYVTYTNFDILYDILYISEIPNLVPVEMRTTIEAVASEDGGLTWSDPIGVSPTVSRGFGERDGGNAPGVFGTLRVVQGSQSTVTPDGTVHVAWMDSTDDRSQEGVAEIQVAKSTDAGQTFSTPVVASVFNETEFRTRTNFFRFWASSFPQLASGPNGELYATYVGRPPDKPNDDGDVFLTASLDDGDTWSRPRRLNKDDLTDHAQFFPAMDVDAAGKIHVMWGDFRDSPSQSSYHIYYTSSDDQGESFGFTDDELGLSVGEIRVSDFASNPNFGFPGGRFLGDYFALAANGAEDPDDEDVYMAWADTRLGEFGPMNTKVAFARQKAVPRPEIFISPPAGPGGQEVVLQGFGYQPDLGVFVQLGDSTISTLRTNLDGEFTARIYMPITSEGSQTISVFDESGNGARTSFFTEFGFGNIAELISDLNDRIDELGSGSSDGS